MNGIKIELLKDVANKGKGSIIEVRGNQAARLVKKGKAKILADQAVKCAIIPSKALKDFEAKKNKVVEKKEEKK